MLSRLFSHARCLPRRAVDCDVAQNLRPVQAARLLSRLPSLGNVLFVHGTPVGGGRAGRDCLLCDAPSMALLDSCWLMGCSRITADGPHEWCQCLDQDGRILARLHLLPDTDYAAWDELLQPSERNSMPASLEVSLPFRPSRARVVRFRLSSLAGLALLEQRAPRAPYSAFSRQMAERLARTEALGLS